MTDLFSLRHISRSGVSTGQVGDPGGLPDRDRHSRERSGISTASAFYFEI
jgi:hypothetical protein